MLEKIMGKEPPPPPPGVPGVEPDIRGATTLREILVKHREKDNCKGCHQLIDPPGFALENYDVMGTWRENYRVLSNDKKFTAPPAELRGGLKNVKWRLGQKVDASGELRSGYKFNNLREYKKYLLSKPEYITHSLVEKVAVYTSGRSMGFSDRETIYKIMKKVADKNYSMKDLIHEVIQSEIFRSK